MYSSFECDRSLNFDNSVLFSAGRLNRVRRGTGGAEIDVQQNVMLGVCGGSSSVATVRVYQRLSGARWWSAVQEILDLGRFDAGRKGTWDGSSGSHQYGVDVHASDGVACAEIVCGVEGGLRGLWVN